MIRITAGEFRGRSILTPKSQKTRPTQAKLRQALFNSIQAHLPEANVLDLFAGSGALGFEALSRGAKSVVFVESAREAILVIRKNAESLKVLDQVHFISDPIPRAISQLKKSSFDLILMDPPYQEEWEEKLLSSGEVAGLLGDEALLVVESAFEKGIELPSTPPFLVKIREKLYGDSVLTTYQRADHESQHPIDKT